MCGIAGYSVTRISRVDRTLAAQALLTGIAERGAEAAGYAWHAPGTRVAVRKQRSGASALLERLLVPAQATEVLLHVRDHTKGHPSHPANNHPIRHGNVVGVHNGTIVNDEEIFASLGRARDEAGMTVDSEAIFALADATRGDARALERLRGSMATAWFDEREPGTVVLARGTGRPLWLGRARGGIYFASTRFALDLLARTVGLRFTPLELANGVVLKIAHGAIKGREHFTPDATVTSDELGTVRAPGEAARCRRRLADLVGERGVRGGEFAV